MWYLLFCDEISWCDRRGHCKTPFGTTQKFWIWTPIGHYPRGRGERERERSGVTNSDFHVPDVLKSDVGYSKDQEIDRNRKAIRQKPTKNYSQKVSEKITRMKVMEVICDNRKGTYRREWVSYGTLTVEGNLTAWTSASKTFAAPGAGNCTTRVSTLPTTSCVTPKEKFRHKTGV